MTNKRKRVYESIIVGLSIILMALCAYMGITAVQKSMTLKMQFSAAPTVACAFAIRQADSTGAYNPIFKNYEGTTISNGVSLTQNILRFTGGDYATATGTAIDLQYTNATTKCSAIKLTITGATVNEVAPYSIFIPQGNTATIENISSPAGGTIQFTMEYVAEITFNLSYAQVSSVNGLTLKSSSTYYAVYGTTPSATLTATQNHMNPPDGVSISNGLGTYTKNATNGIVEFDSISQNVTVTVTNTSMQTYTVVKELTKANVSYDTTPTHGQDFTFTVTIDNDCTQVEVSYKIGNGNYVVLTPPTPSGNSYTYTIAGTNITGDLTINAVASSGYTVTFDANGGSFNSGTTTFEGQTALPTTNIPIPTRPNYTFAGYYKTGNTFAAETIPSADLRYYSNDYLGNTGITPENKELTEDTTLYARWLPFTIGNYVSGSGSDLPTSEVVSNGANVTYDAFAGYKYIQFANHETQENNYGNYSSRYIIIGAGNNLRDKLFDSTKAGFDFKGGKCGTAVTKSAYTESYYLTGPNTNPNNELQDNQILLLSEATLISQTFDSSSVLWQSAGGSEKSDINNYLNTTFLTNSGLSAYAGENSYILTTNLNTAWSPTSSSSSTIQIQSSTQIFLLASKYGDTSTTDARGKAISEYGQTKDLQTYTGQNFCVEDYLGDYIRYYSTTYYHNNPRIFTFNGVSSSYWWLRSGHYYGTDFAYIVYDLGRVDNCHVSNSRGVRPSFCLNLA